ncbi:hypothetical protein E4U53_001226 [Claviceps sorghi]|nr:hypothetical protein E4U53_001226 [Claviceps sorghi]
MNHLPNFIARLARPLTQPARVSMTDPSAPGSVLPEGAQRCTLAAGCFWGTEHMYRRHFAGRGLLDARVGYMGGDVEDPTYRAVCGGKTGHAEVAQLIFDPNQVSYRTLVEFFYKMHDPTTLNAQGPDTGPQYRSAIYFHDPDQERTAREVTRLANEQWWRGAIVTELLPAGRWWSAEEYHQQYLTRNPGGYECPSHFVRPFADLASA